MTSLTQWIKHLIRRRAAAPSGKVELMADTAKIRDLATQIQADATAIIAEIDGPPIPPDPEPPMPITTVPAGGNLQAALDKGGVIKLEDGATFAGSFTMKVAGTRLMGDKAKLQGPKTGPALYIPPGTKDVQATIMEARTNWDQSVILVGAADSKQTTLAQVPRGIQLTITIPTFRGKHAFFINGADVLLLNCNALDVYDPARRDSQAIAILNTPGPVTVTSGKFEACSENIMVGGDNTAIPDVMPSDILIEDVDLSKPLAWKTGTDSAGGTFPVKNNFELKSGDRVTLRRCKIDGCWAAGQSGHSIVITPRNGKYIRNVTFEDVHITNVGQGFNIIAYNDKQPASETPLSNLVIRRVSCKSRGDWGAGRFATWGGGGNTFTIENCTMDTPNTPLYSYKGTTWANGVQGSKLETMGMKILTNDIKTEPYGIMCPNAYGAAWKTCFPDGVISGNSLHGSAALKHKPNLPPDNTYTP